MAVPALDSSIGIGAMGSQTALASQSPGGPQLGLGLVALDQLADDRIGHALVSQLAADVLPGATLSPQALEELGRKAPIVDVAALREPLDEGGDQGEGGVGILARSQAASPDAALEDPREPLAGRLPAPQIVQRPTLEPLPIHGPGVPAPSRPLRVGRPGRLAMRFHDPHATKSGASTLVRERRAEAPRAWRRVARAGSPGSRTNSLMGRLGGRLRHPGPDSMPELPEVETTRRRIAPLLVGHRIEHVETTGPSYFFLTPPPALRRALEGRRVESLERMGKYLVAQLDDEARLLLHLGMTGQLFSSEATSMRLLSATARSSLPPEAQRHFEPDEHTHLRLTLSGRGPRVYFRDVRKFGKVQWLAAGESNARLDRLGVDALAITGEDLFAACRGRRCAIKARLLDQSVCAGVGNIYADEALFFAGVRPGRAARRVTRRECDAIAESLHRVLERSIETGGSSISDYVAPDGSDGGYQDERRVYGRTGEACLVCGQSIKRRIVAQRSSHYCAECQR